MKKIIIFVACIFFLFLISFLIIKNVKKTDEENISNIYIPEEEISVDQERTTIITLYFLNPENNEIVPEARNIDVKELMNNPYERILEMLMEGSSDEKIGKTIPNGTKLNSVKLEGNELIIDFNEILNSNDKDIQDKVAESIESTFLQLKEVNSVKILVNGEELVFREN